MLRPSSGRIVSRRDSLGKYPNLALGVGGGKPTISCRGEFQIRHVCSRINRSCVKRLNVVHVDMDHRGRERIECSWTRKLLACLPEHDQTVLAKQKLIMCTARAAGLRTTKFETESPL